MSLQNIEMRVPSDEGVTQLLPQVILGGKDVLLDTDSTSVVLIK